MGLRKQALGYGDEASQYGFQSYEDYKKENRGGLKGAAKGAATGAKTGSVVGAIAGSFIPGAGTALGGAAGTLLGGYYGGLAGGLLGNRKMKKEYLKYAEGKIEDAKLQEQMSKQADLIEAEKKRQQYLQEKAKELYGTKTTQPIVGGEMPMYKKGGVAKMVTINIEKGELAVDPRTMKVIMDFDGAPKHPKGKDVINQKGNVQVPVGTIIIPADMRKDFLKAKPQQRIEIAAELIERQREGEEKEMEKDGMEGEEMAMQQQMPMQEQMPQGQGMMAMMGGEGEEEGEDMEEAKMGMGGYVKKYVDGGLTKEQIDLLKGYQYGISFPKNPEYKNIAKAMRADPNVDKYLKDIGSRASGNFGLSDDELIAAFTQNDFDFSKFSTPQTTTPSVTGQPQSNQQNIFSPIQQEHSLMRQDVTGQPTTGTATQPESTQRMASTGAGISGLTGGLGTALGMVGSAVPQYFLGRKQEKEAKKALEELQKQEWAKYKPTAELEQQKLDTEAARERARYGFTPQELGARQQQVAQAQRTAYQRAKDTGLSGANQAMMAALSSQRLGALNQIAIEDARMQQQKAQYADSAQRSLAQQYQALANAQTAQDIRYRTMQEQAYGGALQKGLENKYGAFSTAGAGLGYGVGATAGYGIEKAVSSADSLKSLLGLIG